MANLSIATQENVGYVEIPIAKFVPTIKESIQTYKDVLAQVKSNPTVSWDATIQPLEEAAEQLAHAWGLLEHVNSVVNTQEIRAVYDELLPLVSNFHTDILQDTNLYQIYLQLKNSVQFADFNDAQQAIIKHALRDFKLSGVDLSDISRQKLKKLEERLSELEKKFEYNVLDATEGWTYHVKPAQKNLLDGLPQHTIETAKQKAHADKLDGWVLTLDHPCASAVARHASNRLLREEFYAAYNTRASDQGPMAGKWDNTVIIAQILQARQELAHILGYASYLEYSLVPKMARDSKQVKDFVMDMISKIKPHAQKDMQDLKKFAVQQGFEQSLAAWDIAYYSELLHKAKFEVSEEDLRPYFPEPRVLSGLFKLAHKIFKIHVEEVSDFVTWNASVRMFKVKDQHGQLRGFFYCDLYTRDGKQGGAGVAESLDRMRFASGALQVPVTYLTCNFSPAINNQPPLLTHSDVVTLFHEFGHTLHHVMTQVDYRGVAGMNGVEWDAVELPSQFMENWAWEWQVIEDLSHHFETGAPLPRGMFDKMLAAKNFQAGLFLARQLELTLFDLIAHEKVGFDNKLTAHDVIQEVRGMVSVVPVPEFNRFENDFSHIFAGEYSAGYYSYIWAEVLSCDAFEKFQAAGTFNSEIGQEFLSKILEKGGSKPAMDLFVAFAGREPKIDALLRHHGIL